MYFLKIKKNFLNTIDDPKELLLLYYLFVIENKEGDILFSIKNFIEYWKYKPKRNNDKINQKVKNMLIKFKNSNIITCSDNIDNLSISKNIHINFTKINNLPWYIAEEKSYISLSIKEVNEIKQYLDIKATNIQIEKILLIYVLIKSYMNFSPQNIQYCFSSLDTLSNISKISKATIKKYINILKQAKIIYVYEIGNFIDTYGNIIPVSSVYTLEPIDFNALKNNISAFLYNFKEWEIAI